MVRRSGDNSAVTGVLLDSETSTPYRFGLVWKYILKGCRGGVIMMTSAEVQHAARDLAICLCHAHWHLSCYNIQSVAHWHLSCHTFNQWCSYNSMCAWRNNALQCNYALLDIADYYNVHQ